MTGSHSVGVRELRQEASRLLDRVKRGHSIEITEHGKPVALLIPVPESNWEKAIALGLIDPPANPGGLKEMSPVKSNLAGTSLERLLADRDSE